MRVFWRGRIGLRTRCTHGSRLHRCARASSITATPPPHLPPLTTCRPLRVGTSLADKLWVGQSPRTAGALPMLLPAPSFGFPTRSILPVGLLPLNSSNVFSLAIQRLVCAATMPRCAPTLPSLSDFAVRACPSSSAPHRFGPPGCALVPLLRPGL